MAPSNRVMTLGSDRSDPTCLRGTDGRDGRNVRKDGLGNEASSAHATGVLDNSQAKSDARRRTAPLKIFGYDVARSS